MWTREQFEAALIDALMKLAWYSGGNYWLTDRDERIVYEQQRIYWLQEQLTGGPHLLEPKQRDPLARSEDEGLT